jgi:hypothetical protein
MHLHYKDKKNIFFHFSQDLSVVLQDAIEKSIDHVKKQYEKS